MVSKSGCKLLNGDSANSALVEDLIPQCDLITPNLPGTVVLTLSVL
jgi:hydroxymethylpyrimidine/phosphomethylpyrimidine kinase